MRKQVKIAHLALIKWHMNGDKDMKNQKILVVGGGISGITATLEAAEAGYEVFLVEKAPFLGGRVSQINQYFPKLCPPNCGLEINYKRIKGNPNVHPCTFSEISEIQGTVGDFTVSVKTKARKVNEKCTACGECVKVCPVERANDFNCNLDKTKAIYMPSSFAIPQKYTIDSQVCQGASCAKCVEVCSCQAIDLQMEEKIIQLHVGSIIWATGWSPYPAEKIEYYGYGRYPNVVTNLMIERMAAINGPSQGKISRPSDGKDIETIAFVQCAGSRDQNHLQSCSRVCCMASLKQITYIRKQYPNAKIAMYYIDIRTPGINEEFYQKVLEENKFEMINGKPGEIQEDAQTKQLIVTAEDMATKKVRTDKYDMVVLAVGMQPNTSCDKLPVAEANYDKDGFILIDSLPEGMYSAGCVKKPYDVAFAVQDATSAALKAIQAVRRN